MCVIQEELNILQNLSPEEFLEVRGLVIDMVLATDMSSHFDQLKHMRLILSEPDRYALHILVHAAFNFENLYIPYTSVYHSCQTSIVQRFCVCCYTWQISPTQESRGAHTHNGQRESQRSSLDRVTGKRNLYCHHLQCVIATPHT